MDRPACHRPVPALGVCEDRTDLFLLLVPSEEPGEDQPAIGAGDGGSAGGGASGSDLKAAGPVHQHRDRFLYPLPDLYGWDQL